MIGRLFKNWLPVLVWMVLIFTASTERGSQKRTEAIVRPPVEFINPTITQPELERIHFDVRKAAHFTEYAILALLLCRALRGEPGVSSWGIPAQVGLTLLVCASYAATDEWHQRFVNSRTPSIKDILIDAGGALAGALIFYLIVRFWPWKPSGGKPAAEGAR